MFQKLKEIYYDLICNHVFISKSSMTDSYGKREILQCHKCGCEKTIEIKNND